MKKKLALMTGMLFGLAVVIGSCATLMGPTEPTESNFKDPVITFESFQVPQYDGYWYISKKTKPTKGEAGNRGAPLPMSFVFNIHNPNPYPVKLDGFNFTVFFDNDFALVTVNNQDTYWIPAGKTDQVRATTMITTRSALLSLLVTGGYGLKERGWSPWDALKRWWTGIPDRSFPITVKEGAFNFEANGIQRVLAFETNVV